MRPQIQAQAIDLKDGANRVIRVLYAHRFLIGLVAVYIALGTSLMAALDLLDGVTFLYYKNTLLVPTAIGIVGFFVVYPLYVMIAVKPDRLLSYYLTDLRDNWLTTERLVGGLIVYTCIPVATTMFSSVKGIITTVQPFSWDQTFLQWDRILHGGRDPWQLLQPLLGYPWVTSTISLFYSSWFVMVVGVYFWQAFSLRDRRLRMQFLLTYVLLAGLLGNVMAIILSSAGPVYFGRVTGLQDPYEPLMSYLYQVAETHPVWAMKVQEFLWWDYETGARILGAGISAMPSLHVALVTLLALVGWRVHRIAGILLSVYAVIILIGSVHLGWHYAVDGYVAIVFTVAIWYLVGKFLDFAFQVDR
jgi:hypothetical protein